MESVPVAFFDDIVDQFTKKAGEIRNLKPVNDDFKGMTSNELLEVINKYELYCKEIELLNHESFEKIKELTLNEHAENEVYSLFRLLSDTMPDMLWAKDINKQFIFTNKAMCEKLLNASDTNEPIGKTDLYFAQRENNTHPENPEWHTFGQLCLDSDQATLKAMKQMQFYEFGNVKGKFLYLDVHKAPLFNKEGELIGVVGSGRDITEQMLAQKEIEDQKVFLHQLINTISNPIFYKDKEGRYFGCNNAFPEFLGIPKDQLMGKTVHEIYDSELADIYHEKDRELLDKIGHQIYETKIQNADGTLHDVLFHKETLIDAEGNIEGLVGVIVDITERKQNEEKIKTLLKEKELVLKEVHHRIKNNMNTVRGLLALQAMSTNEKATVSALNDAESRIHSMMILYDKLYKSVEFNEISLKNYLPELIDDISKLFPVKAKIIIEKDIEDIILNVQKIQPITIIINELITNIFKYAFTDRNEGTVTISAKRNDNILYIIIRDNGIGIPESIDFETSNGFGIRLVKMLADQLEGTIELERVNGSKFTLNIPI